MLSVITMFPYWYLELSLAVFFTGALTTSAKTLVEGTVGQNITLPCHYSTDEHGTTTTCWGRGNCPIYKCSKTIVWTNGREVTYRQSRKYQLMGDIHRGNVSLTVVRVEEADDGTYCCRVEIPGWGNDQKQLVKLVIKKEPRWSSTTESLSGNISIFPMIKEPRQEGSSRTNLYVGIGICAAVLGILCVILLIVKCYFLKQQKLINPTSQVTFSSSTTREIQRIVNAGIHTQENIYTLD